MVISMPSRESGGDARGMEPGSDLHRRRRGHGPAASDGSASDAESSVDAHSSVDHGSFRSEGPPGNDEPSASSEPHPRDRGAVAELRPGAVSGRRLRRVGVKIGRKVLEFHRPVFRLGPLHLYRTPSGRLRLRWRRRG